MRGWRVSGVGEPAQVLEAAELDLPEPGPGQVRIRTEAAGIGLPDVLMCRAVYPLTPKGSFTPGQEAAGVVTAVGEGAAFSLGDRVMGVTDFVAGHGSFAEECLLYSDSSFPVPAGLEPAEAAGFWIPHLTAWVGLVVRGCVREGEWLVVLGAAGGSGVAAVQLGRALGARVVAVVGDSGKAAFVQGRGVEVAIVNRGADDLVAQIREATGGDGADLLYDPVGGEQAEAAAGALRRYGRLLAVGFAAGRWPQVDTHRLVVANTSVLGVFAGGFSRAELDHIHAELSSLIASGRLTNAVTEQVPFDGLPDALTRLAARQVTGKMVMIP
jgi:NADPH2:quinone reductase